MTEILKPKGSYFGCDFYQLANVLNVFATATFADTHVKIEGDLTADLTKGSYAYGDEVQLKVWSREKPVVKVERAPEQKGYYRVEIYLPVSEALNFCRDVLVNFEKFEKSRVSVNVSSKHVEKLEELL